MLNSATKLTVSKC